MPNKILFIQFLLASGINAYRGATQLAYVKPPEGRKDAENSQFLMESIVYMPIHSGMEYSEIRETVERTIECYNKLITYLNRPGIPKPQKVAASMLLERPKL